LIFNHDAEIAREAAAFLPEGRDVQTFVALFKDEPHETEDEKAVLVANFARHFLNQADRAKLGRISEQAPGLRARLEIVWSGDWDENNTPDFTGILGRIWNLPPPRPDAERTVE